MKITYLHIVVGITIKTTPPTVQYNENNYTGVTKIFVCNGMFKLPRFDKKMQNIP